MLAIKSEIAQSIAQTIKGINASAELDASTILGMLEYPPDEKMGDIALPCFKLSKTLRMPPVKIAEAIANELSVPSTKNVVAINGYLNIYLDGEYLANKVVSEVNAKGEKYGAPEMGEGKTVVLDYSSPNVAKPFHIGHLGTTVIGHSLKKLHEFAGYKCVGIDYLGDWGTQFG
jgi:arginyl-tRNA synthetase